MFAYCSFLAHISLSKSSIIICRYCSLKGLGFRIQVGVATAISYFFSSSSSPEIKADQVFVTNMGEEDDSVTVDQNSFGGAGEDSLLRNRHSSPLSQPPPLSSKILTLPTVLTLGRVAAVPILVATFYVDCWWGRTATTSIFIAAAITDWLDGYIARKMRLGSAFGAFLDPVADKLMVAATLILLCTKPVHAIVLGPVPWLVTVPSIAIIGREITMSAVREWAASQNGKLSKAVAVNSLGKWKTATQMIALTILLVSRESCFERLLPLGIGLLYVSAGLSIWSLVVYMRKIWRALLKK